MVQRDTPWPAGTPCWVRPVSRRLARATTFYSCLFGWDIQAGPPEAGGYTMCEAQRPAGGGDRPEDGTAGPPAWTTYLATENADDDRGQDLRGRRPGAGRAIRRHGRRQDGRGDGPGRRGFRHLAGRAAHGHATGQRARLGVLEREHEPAATRPTRSFYQPVFGYQYDDIGGEDFHYATFKTTGDPMGGIGDLGDVPGRGGAGALDDLLRRSRRRRRGRDGDQARRHTSSRPAVGHPVRPDGHPDRRPGRRLRDHGHAQASSQ